MLGTGTSSVTGDSGEFIVGRTVSDTTASVSDWLNARRAQSFDAVFVRPGAEVAIHIDVALPIDYSPNGRQLTHDRQRSAGFRPATLD